jgi:hypothetical protein
MKQQELLQEQTGGENDHTKQQSGKLWDREQIEHSPFWIVGNKEQGYHITMGKYRLTLENEPLPTALDARIWLETHKWDVILSVALCAYTDMTYKTQDTDKLAKKS